MKTRNLFASIIAMALFGATPSAWAVWTGASSGTTYTSGGTGDYDATSNWAGATIDDSFSGFLLTGDLTVTLDANRTATAGMNFDHDGAFNLTIANNNTTAKAFTLNGGISFQPSSATRTLTIGSGANQIGFNLNNSTRTFTVGSNQTMIVNGAITSSTAASGLLTKEGAGLLTLNVASTYTGLTTVNGGELRWGVANAIAGDLTINNGGTVNIQSFSDTIGTITIANGGSITGTTGVLTTGGGGLVSNDGGTISGFSAGAGLRLGGGITYNSTGPGSTTLQVDRIFVPDLSPTFNIANGAAAIDFEITGTLSGGGNNIGRTITKTGSGVMQFSGNEANTTSINQMPLNIWDGTVIFNKSAEVNAIPNSTITIGDGIGFAGSAILQYRTSNNQIQSSSITINSDGLFDLNGLSETTSGGVTLNSTGQMDFNGGTLSVGAVTIAATGAGANATSITNTAGTGGLTVSSLAITPEAGYTTTLSLGSSGTLTLGGDVTFNAAGTGRAQITGSSLSLGAANRTFTVGLGSGADYDLLISAGISGASRSLTKNGTGKVVLTGSNSYTGGTTVNAGTLQIGDGTTAGTMATSGALTMGNATFSVLAPASGNSTQTVASLATTANTGSTIKLTPGASGNTTLTITSTTIPTGAAVNFDYTAGTTVSGTVGNNYVVWNPTLTAGIIGGAYTVTDSGGTGFATTSGGNVVRLADPGSAGLPVSTGSSTGSYFVGSGYSTDSTTTPGSLVEALSGAVAANNVTVDTTGLTSGANLALGENLLTLGVGMVISGPNPYEISGSGAGGLKAAAAGGTINLYNASSGTVTISAPIVNNSTSKLTVDGPGTTILSGVNTYTGATVVNGGIVRLSGTMAASPITINNGVAQLGTATSLTSANTITFGLGSTGSLQLLGNNLTIGALASNATTLGTPVIANNAVANATLTIDSGSSTTFGGVIQDGTGGGTLALTKSGAGTLTLSGSNTYSGGTTINAGRVGITSDANLGDAAGTITFNGGELYVNNDFSSTRNVILNAVSGNQVLLQGNSDWTNSGALTGDGGITFRQNPNGGTSMTLTSTANTFKGALGIQSNNGGMLVKIRSLADSVSANGNIIFGLSSSSGNPMTLEWDSAAGGPLTLNNRKSEFAGDGTAWGTIKNSNTANPITITTDTVNGGTGVKTLTLDSAAGPNNLFAGNIDNGTGGGTIAVTKSGAGRWSLSGNMSNTGGLNIGGGTLTLAGTNTYSGQTVFSAAGTMLIFAGAQACSPNTSFLMNNNSSTADSSVKLLDDVGGVNGSAVSVTNIFTIQNNNAPGNAHTFIVGNNNTANGGTSSGTTMGGTIGIGTLNWNTYASGTTAYGPIQIQGTDGYRLQINSVVLHNAANLTSGTVGQTTFNPTTANATFGTVTVGTGNTGLGYQTFVMDGITADNWVTGSISDASDVGTSGRPLRVTKSNTSTWSLSGTNTYSGGTTITAGKLQFNGADSLPTSGTVSVGANGHLSLADGTARSQTVSALTLTSLASLSFDWTGDGTGDQLTSTAAITPTAASRFAVNLNRSGTPGGSVTLLTGGASSTLSSSTFYLANATDYTATLTATPTTVSVGSFTTQTPLTTFYWQGNKLAGTSLSGVDNAWALSNGTNGNWSSTTTAYTATPLTPGATADVIFSKDQAGKTQQSTVLGADVTVKSVTIDDSTAVTIAGPNGATLTLMGTSTNAGTVASPGSAISVTANAANPTISSRVNLGADQTWHVASGKILTVSGIVGGDYSLTKASPGAVVLSATPSYIYTGVTTINAGVLAFTSQSSLSGGKIVINDGGTLLVQSGGGQLVGITIGNNIELGGAGGSRTVQIYGSNQKTTFTGAISVTASENTTLNLIAGNSPSVVGGNGTTLGEKGNLTITGAIPDGSGGVTLGLNISMDSQTASGVYVNLSGKNTFTGPIAVSYAKAAGGYLTIGGESSGIGQNYRTTAVMGSGYLGGGNYTNTIFLGANTILDYLSSADQILGGEISGVGQLLKEGTGTLTLTGNNTYSGGTTVSAGTLVLAGVAGTNSGPTTVTAGTLVLAGSSCLSETNLLTIASGGKVQLNAGVKEKVGLLTLDGVSQALGSYGSTSSSAANKNDTYFSGTGVLYVGVDVPPPPTLILFR